MALIMRKNVVRHLRLHRRRRRHGGLPAGQSPVGRSQTSRVLLLEAGGKDNYHWIHIPVGYLYLMGNPRADWGFKHAPPSRASTAAPRLSARQACSAAARRSTA